jgi:excisionase family DNA binding protein
MEVSHEVSQFLAVCDHRVTRVTTFSTRHPNSAWRTLGYSNFAQHVSPHRMRRAHIMATILLTIDQVASRMQISRTSVYRLIATGQLDVVKIMGSTRISEHALEDTIAHHTSFGTAVSR